MAKSPDGPGRLRLLSGVNPGRDAAAWDGGNLTPNLTALRKY